MKSWSLLLVGIFVGAMLAQTGDAQDDSLEPRPARALNHIGIVVEDYEAAYAFYTEDLGLKEAYTVERDGGPLLTYLQLNRETFVELIPARDGQTTGVSHFGIEVADVDAFVARLRERDLEISGPGTTPANARFVQIRDTDSVEIEVMEFGPEASQYKAMQAWED